MSSNQNTVDFIVEQMAGAGGVTAKKMFGEYGVFCAGKMVAIIADDNLFVKPTATGRAFLARSRKCRPMKAQSHIFSFPVSCGMTANA